MAVLEKNRWTMPTVTEVECYESYGAAELWYYFFKLGLEEVGGGCLRPRDRAITHWFHRMIRQGR